MSSLYLYFSGTGNSRYALEIFAREYEGNNKYEIHSIEEDLDFPMLLYQSDLIILGYPIYGSMIPEPMRVFLERYKIDFSGKEIIVISTQLLFSGDGAALALYYLKGSKVKVKSTLHINMPNNITDLRLFPIRTVEESEKKLLKAERFIQGAVQKIKAGKELKMGRRWYSRALGYLVQRVHFNMFYKSMQKWLKVNNDTCTQCGKCVRECPSGNLSSVDGKIILGDKCFLCYRCINICPTQSFKMLGRHYPKNQYYKK